MCSLIFANKTPIRRPADPATRFFLCLLLLLAGCSRAPQRIASADVDYWTCTMHPSVHAEAAGKCPICGMDLVPIRLGKEEQGKPSEFTVPIQRQQQIGVTY